MKENRTKEKRKNSTALASSFKLSLKLHKFHWTVFSLCALTWGCRMENRNALKTKIKLGQIGQIDHCISDKI
jgi:hypothetical protein